MLKDFLFKSNRMILKMFKRENIIVKGWSGNIDERGGSR